MYYARETVDKLRQSTRVIIYGAGIVAREVASCLMGAPYYLSIECFMVSDRSGNPSELIGIPVIDINEGKKKYRDMLIVVAAMEKYLDDIQDNLRRNHFRDFILFGFESDLWSAVRGNYYRALREKQEKPYLDLDDELVQLKGGGRMSDTDVHIYRVCSHMDRKLQSDLSEYAWELPIQVGAALTEQRICSICDDRGENISHKNREYCELTALYWIWKNDISKYAGMCHYRRHFQLNRELLWKLSMSDIDVVLTIPILNFPDVRTTYAHDHIESDWDIMLEAVRNLQPQYYETAQNLQQGVFYYAYNMFIARKGILDDYCEWLFPILSYCEEKCARKEDNYQNRYIGFLAERLMSVYFLYHDSQYKIVHAEKHFLT